MRVFRIWRTAEAKVLIDGREETITCPGGSNRSAEEALADGARRLETVRRRIEEARPWKRRSGEDGDYEADIREEPLKWIGTDCVVTRNRYGAEVLNASSLAILDVDEPPFRIWELFRSARSAEERKAATLRHLERRIDGRDLAGFSVRLYETRKGYRVLLDGRAVDPRSDECRKLMRSFNADGLYALLCRKQNCFRARLTPKPHRMRMRTIRVKPFPYGEEEAAQVAAWAEEYASKGRSFATCRLVKVVGEAIPSLAVRYHDERTRAASNLPLA
jgi:hypothetical protein